MQQGEFKKKLSNYGVLGGSTYLSPPPESLVSQTNKEATVHKSACVQADPNNASGPIRNNIKKFVIDNQETK